MEKLNIAEILKNCPTGMELDCTMYEDCTFLDIDAKSNSYLIRITTPCGIRYLDKYGCYTTDPKSKCIIFPKGKTTWEGFQKPFKDGDVLAYYPKIGKTSIYIYRYHPKMNTSYYVALSGIAGRFRIGVNPNAALNGYNDSARFATEEEKEKLFKAIKDNGYRWNAETKTLEKLIKPKFKVGDRIKKKGDARLITIKDVRDNCYIITIPDFFDNCYITDKLSFSNQNDYELVPNKFDITTLKPFESRVLVRTNNRKWVAAFYSHYDKDSLLHHCVVGGLWYEQCIPYKNNEYLLDTTNDCDEYYKTWE